MKGKFKETIDALSRLHESTNAMFDESTKLKILIVDDEIDHRELIKRYVSAFGYDCLTAADGEQALECLASNAINLVITDMLMPNMDGMQLLVKIKQQFPQVSTIALTGYGKSYTFKDIVDAGAAEFLEKPINKEVLEAKIERVFQEQMLLASYLNEIKTQKILLELLALSTREEPLAELLHDFLLCIMTFPWLELEPKGAILLVDEQDRECLVMVAQHNLSPPLLEICARVPFGRCLCGQAAKTRQVIFSDHLEGAHHNRFDGIQEHGHYCIPILQAAGELLGVFTLYVKAGTIHNPTVEMMLRAAAQTIAGIIVSKRNTDLLADQERRYQAMTDSVIDAIIMMDAKGCIVFWNPAASRIFGYALEEVIGKDLHEMIMPERYRQQQTAALQEFFKSGHGGAIGKCVELMGRGKDGQEIPIELSLSALKSHGNWQAVGIIRDISKRKALEKEKDLLNIQLRQAQKMEAIGTLAGGIAHDFNNILGAVIGFADMAKEEVAAESQVHADLERILTAGHRAKDLVRQILTFSRQKDEEFFPTQIQLIIKEALKLLRAAIPAGIEIHQEIDPKCEAVLVDPTQIHQVIMNLCTNASYAMRKQGGHLRVGLKNLDIGEDTSAYPLGIKAGRYVKLTVADSGEGMATEVLEHIFEPYYTTKPQGEGTGFGLSLVHGIISGLGGVIGVESELGKGTAFEIYLPTASHDNASPALAANAPFAFGSEHVLLVDDELSLVEVTARKLTKLGYTVTQRTSSVEALAAFTANPDKFDLVITDHAMPNMTGVDMASQMLTLKAGIPIILTTGFIDPSSAEYALTLGIKKIIKKPIDIYELTSVMREVLAGLPLTK